MVPLGSCTMKLNAASELTPLGWSTVADPHPYAPTEQNSGYLKMIHDLETWLGEITGLPHVSSNQMQAPKVSMPVFSRSVRGINPVAIPRETSA